MLNEPLNWYMFAGLGGIVIGIAMATGLASRDRLGRLLAPDRKRQETAAAAAESTAEP